VKRLPWGGAPSGLQFGSGITHDKHGFVRRRSLSENAQNPPGKAVTI
jgi:hypothetical protein